MASLIYLIWSLRFKLSSWQNYHTVELKQYKYIYSNYFDLTYQAAAWKEYKNIYIYAS